MKNRGIPQPEVDYFVGFIKDNLANYKKNVGNGYLPLHYYAV